MNATAIPVRSSRSASSISVLAALVLAIGFAVLSPQAAQAAAETSIGERAAATPQNQAKTALALAVAELGKHHPAKAAAALRTYAKQSDLAHQAATDLIGKPPTDPESDVPPGPAAVLQMIRLDHQATMMLVPQTDHLKRSTAVKAMRRALDTTLVGRNRMIQRVVALPPEGAGEDYADGMSDVLGIFPKEISVIDTGLAGYTLTSVARTALSAARGRVVTANDLMNGAYGGGE